MGRNASKGGSIKSCATIKIKIQRILLYSMVEILHKNTVNKRMAKAAQSSGKKRESLNKLKEDGESKKSKDVCQNSDKAIFLEMLARDAGTSRDTAHRAICIIKKGTDEIKEALRKGEMSINEGYNQIKGKGKTKKEHKEEQEQKEEQENNKLDDVNISTFFKLLDKSEYKTMCSP